MLGICILFYFTLATIRAQYIDTNPNEDRAKIIWHDDKLPPYYFPSRDDTSLGVVTPQIPITDDISSWNSKDSSLNLQIPKFLFNDETKPGLDNNVQMNVPQTKPLTDAQPKLVENADTNTLNTLVDNTEPKVVDEQFKPTPSELEDQFDQKIMADIQSASTQKQSTTEENLIREKIFTLAKETEKDLDAKVKIIEKTNSMFKHNNFYKLGFIVSYINTTHNALSDLMKHVERNRGEWDVLKILNAYVQIKKTKEFLAEMLSILNFLQSRQSLMAQPMGMEKKKLALPHHQGIAWSYYDDQ